MTPTVMITIVAYCPSTSLAPMQRLVLPRVHASLQRCAQRNARSLSGTSYPSSSSSSTRQCPAFAVPRAALATAAALGGVAAGAAAASRDDPARAEAVAESGHELVNWSASHECQPSEFYTPESVADVEAILKRYHDQGKKVRCMGAGVSPNGLGFSTPRGKGNEAIMTMALMDKILNVDVAKQQVTVEAGIIVGDLLEKLRAYGLTMQNVASIREQQVGGICQAGCHGTGASISPIDDHIVEMEIVTPARGRLVLSKTQNAELFELAKCGLGALGVVTKITFQCVPKHYLVEETRVHTIEDVRRHHSQWLKEFQHLRYMWIPFTDAVVVVQCRRVSDVEATHADKYPPVQYDNDTRLAEPRRLYLELCQGKPEPDYLDWSFTKLRDKLLEFKPLDIEHVKRVNATEKAFWKLSEGFRVALSDDIVGFDCGGQQLVQEVSFPTHGTLDVDFVDKLMQRIESEGIPAHAPIEQRWTSRSTSAMSPSGSWNPAQVFSWVGVILYLPTLDKPTRAAITQRFDEFNAMYRDYMEQYGASEHWAKLEWPAKAADRAKIRERMRRRYPLDKFREARDELDPHHILSNHIVDELLA